MVVILKSLQYKALMSQVLSFEAKSILGHVTRFKIYVQVSLEMVLALINMITLILITIIIYAN